jgi:hypothetical protein
MDKPAGHRGQEDPDRDQAEADDVQMVIVEPACRAWHGAALPIGGRHLAAVELLLLDPSDTLVLSGKPSGSRPTQRSVRRVATATFLAPDGDTHHQGPDRCAHSKRTQCGLEDGGVGEDADREREQCATSDPEHRLVLPPRS